MSNIFESILNLSGNYIIKINGITEATSKFEAKVERAMGPLSRLFARKVPNKTISGRNTTKAAVLSYPSWSNKRQRA